MADPIAGPDPTDPTEPPELPAAEPAVEVPPTGFRTFMVIWVGQLVSLLRSGLTASPWASGCTSSPGR